MRVQWPRFGTAARDQRGREQPSGARSASRKRGQTLRGDGHQVLREDLPLRRRHQGKRVGVHHLSRLGQHRVGPASADVGGMIGRAETQLANGRAVTMRATTNKHLTVGRGQIPVWERNADKFFL